MTEHLLRPKTGYCFKCGAGYMTLGSSTRWIPHESWCPKVARRRPQSVAEQDREREALAVDPLDSPWLNDHRKERTP